MASRLTATLCEVKNLVRRRRVFGWLVVMILIRQGSRLLARVCGVECLSPNVRFLLCLRWFSVALSPVIELYDLDVK